MTRARDEVRPRDAATRDAIRQALGALSAIAPIGLFATDDAGVCWYLNQRLIDYLGLAVHSRDDRPVRLELSGDEPRLELLPSARLVGVAGTAKAAVASEHLKTRVIPIVRHDGSANDWLGIVVDESSDDGAARILGPSQRLVDTLVERSPEIITVLDPDGTWRYSNEAATRLIGYQADFDPANGIVSLLHPEDADAAVEIVEKMREGKDLITEMPVMLRVRAADGSWHHLESVIENLLEDPVVAGFLVRSRDVTDTVAARRALLEANERLSALIGSLHLAVLLEDAQGSIVLTNEAFTALFELESSPTELFGKTIGELGSQFFRRFGDPTSRSTLAGAKDDDNGDHRPVFADLAELIDGRVLERDYIPIVIDGDYHGHVWLFRDVSAHAHAEAEWASLIESQRKENLRLVELDRMKAAFLAEISHELRTPLTSILSFAELLTDGLGNDDPKEQAEFLEIIRRNADRLLRLVDDLLLLDRIETGAMPLEWGVVDMPTLVSSCVSTFSHAAEAKSISLETEIGEGPSVAGDEGRLAQVLDVLVSNALKFTPEAGRIIVRAVPVEKMWRVEVIDSGIGVPASEQGEIFERFFRATNARISRIPGSGLGLSVARAICELHGGTIVLRSKEGTGTTVAFTVPLERHRADDEPESGMKTGDSQFVRSSTARRQQRNE